MTIPQSELSPKNREKNITNAFKLNSSYSNIQNKHILLIDDLITTGTTLKEVGHIVAKLNPASITAIVACMATNSTTI